MRPDSDTFGMRCPTHDPVVEILIYGGPTDFYKLIVEKRVVRDGKPAVDRHIIPKKVELA